MIVSTNKIHDDPDSWREQGLYRTLKSLPETGGRIRWNDHDILNFSSNDYLDLAQDPRVKGAAMEAIRRWGCSATASPLMCGHLEIHAELESRLARMCGQNRALVFGSGFLTNLGILSCLTSRDDIVFSDRLNHASLIDGVRLGPAKMIRYRHLDTGHLEELLEHHPCSGRRWITTESVFSMDGDTADLPCLRALADRFNCLLVVDEAHALGVLGDQGGGLSRTPGGSILPDITIATLGKSLGSLGGFAACNGDIHERMINRVRPYIYSTALAPACAAAALKAAEIIMETEECGKRLLENSRYFRKQLCDGSLNPRNGNAQIIPLPIGGNQETMDVSASLENRGIFAVAIRPPTVPEGTARLRFSLTLAHTRHDLQAAARAISETVLASHP